MNEEAQKLVELAIERLLDGDPAGALALIDEAFAEEPAGRPGWHYLRAAALHALGRGGVKEALAACLKADPVYEPALELLGRLDRAAVAATVPVVTGTQPTFRSAAAATTAPGGVSAPADGSQAASLPTVDPAVYEMGPEFARGGMGRILRARQRTLDRPVAVKELTRASEASAARFLREAFITARLQHPAIVPIYEAGRWPTGAPFYAMRLVQGSSLEDVIAGCTDLQSRLAVLPRVIAAGEAVAYAHSQKIIHRDLKPANILCGDFGETVVIDWGVAKDLGAGVVDEPAVDDATEPTSGTGSGAAMAMALGPGSSGPVASGSGSGSVGRGSRSGETLAGTVVGTPAFMPVEQAMGKPVDERADVYALGAILYNLLSGEPPYRASSYAQVLLHVAQRAPQPLEERTQNLPVDLLDIVRKAMSREARDRYPTARELVADLRSFQTGKLVGAHTYSRLELSARWLHQHRLQLSASMAGVALVALAATGLSAWDQQRLKVSFYANKVTRHGVPEGIGPVGEGSQKRRAVTYRFQRRGGLVSRVDRINGSGHLVDDSSSIAVQLLRYDQRGRLREETHRDRLGKLRERNLVSVDGLTLQHVDELGRPRPRKETDDWGRPVKDTDVTRVTRKFDSRGFITELRFHNLYGSPRSDERKAYGYRVQADDRGQIVYWQALGPKGDPTPTSEGLAALRRSFDELGNVTREQYLGTSGQPVVLARYKIASYRATFDRVGNEVRRAFFDAEGKPVLSSESIGGWSTRYDDRGNTLRRDFFDLAGEPVALSSGFASLVFRVDARGLELERQHLDRARKPVAPKDGTPIWRGEYDREGRLIRSAYHAADGKPTAHPSGYHRFDIRYDARSNRIEEAYFGLDGKPFNLAAGWATWRGRYNDQDKELESSYFDAAGKPAVGGSGHHSLLTEYSDRGQPVLIRYLGTDGKPVMMGSYAAIRMEYDDRGHEIARTYLGPDGKPTLHREGYASVRTRFDQQGNAVEVRHVDVAGQAVINTDLGHATEEREYDPAGRLLATAYRGPDGRPMLGSEGAARLTYQRDDRGRVVEQRFFDVQGKLDAGKRGFAVLRLAYDAAGNESERRTLDAAEKPVAGRRGYATVRRRFDGRAHEVERSYSGPDDRPVLDSQDRAATVRTTFDDQGRPTRVEYLGKKGQPLLGAQGYAQMRKTHDRRGLELTLDYLREDGTPTLSTDHIAGARWSYDEAGLVTEQRYLGVKGQPWYSHEAGHAHARIVRDPTGLVEHSYFGTDDRPAPDRSGCAVRRRFGTARPKGLPAVLCVDTKGKSIEPERQPPRRTEMHAITSIRALSDRAGLARVKLLPGDRPRVAQRGAAYKVYRAGQKRDDGVGTAVIQSVTPGDGRSAGEMTVSIVVPWGAALPEAGDLVELPGPPVAEGAPAPSALQRLDALAIRLLDPNREPYWKPRQFRGDDSAAAHEPILAAMARDIRETAISLERTLKNPELARPRPRGLHQGRSVWDVMKAVGPDDLRDFFDFVLTFPGKYMGTPWKINETFATWLVNDSPTGQEADKRLKAAPRPPPPPPEKVGPPK